MTKELIRAAGGIVHGDGNIFFTNIDQLAAYIKTAAAAQALPPPSLVGNLAIGAGAIYDFAGYLTSRDKRITLSWADDAGPAADAIKVFLEKRGISDDVTPAIADWHKCTQPAQPADPHLKQCPGIPAAGCNYTATCSQLCNKCGKVHQSHRLSAPPSEQPAQPAAAPQLTIEQDLALCEANCIAEADVFFASRPAIDFPGTRRIFYAGHRRAWLSYPAIVAAAQAQTSGA